MPLLTDYKFRYIKRTDDNRTIVDFVVYEGAIQDVTTKNPITGVSTIESVYVRSGIVSEKICEFDGIISHDDICDVLNEELAKDKSRIPHPVQAVVRLPKFKIKGIVTK